VLDVSEQTISRRYRLLNGAGIVKVVGQLDSQRLGQSDWALRIRCSPDAAMPVASGLAQRPDTSWIQVTSGGTEIFCAVRADGDRQRTAMLLEQIPSGRRIVSLDAYCLLHLFVSAFSGAPGLASALSPEEQAQLDSPDRVLNAHPRGKLQEEDWALMRVLSEDGRATFREMAARTHWHESTVRRRVEELVASGLLYFVVDVAYEELGVGSRAMLWMSVAPANLMAVGQALAGHREVGFAAATTGPTNLVASVSCRDDYALFEYLTREIAALDGVSHMESAIISKVVKRNATVESRT
jgi:DNA-binding Lrp family transcriptional regulator